MKAGVRVPRRRGAHWADTRPPPCAPLSSQMLWRSHSAPRPLAQHPAPQGETPLTCQDSLGTALLHQATPAPASKTRAPAAPGGAQPRGMAGPGAPMPRHWKGQSTTGEPPREPPAGAAYTAGGGWPTSAAAGRSAEPSSGAPPCL